ncbi:MAG: 50S ribosomal protein L11 methyltransferase [Parasporobacterium sp.]|nr:50S ribosomal protein L11 methyltransferase [Parasporobacterium sp.]
MIWSKYTLKVNTDAVDFVSGVLDMLGVEGIEVEDKLPLTDEELSKMYVDLPPDLGPDDGRATVRFYVNPDMGEKCAYDKDNYGGIVRNSDSSADDEAFEDVFNLTFESEEDLIAELLKQLEDAKEFLNVGEVVLEKGESDDADWKDKWKEYFKPFTIDDILIKPTWEDVPADFGGKTVVEIDPGMAFGTGKHETTKLCIKNIKTALSGGADAGVFENEATSAFMQRAKILGSAGKTLLDIGCGSGILAIISLLLGAEKIVAVDIDEYAVENAKENFALNIKNADSYELFAGNLLEDEMLRRIILGTQPEGYDIVVANILADVIIPLSGIVNRFMKKGGIFISSGIINTKEDDVRAAIERNRELEILEVSHMNDWVSITARRKDL